MEKLAYLVPKETKEIKVIINSKAFLGHYVFSQDCLVQKERRVVVDHLDQQDWLVLKELQDRRAWKEIRKREMEELCM